MPVARLLGIILLLAAVTDASAQEPPITSFSTSGSYALPSDSGALSWKFGGIDLIVTFRGMAFGRLSSLTVALGDWNLDASEHVQRLPAPYPARMVVQIEQLDSGNKVKTFSLLIPYREVELGAGDPAAEPVCRDFQLIIEDGRVIETRAFETDSFRCYP